MKVWELREQLAQFDAHLDVLVSVDEEGNGFHKLRDFSVSPALPDDEYEYNWTVYHPDDVEEEKAEAEQWGQIFEPRRVLVLWP